MRPGALSASYRAARIVAVINVIIIIITIIDCWSFIFPLLLRLVVVNYKGHDDNMNELPSRNAQKLKFIIFFLYATVELNVPIYIFCTCTSHYVYLRAYTDT